MVHLSQGALASQQTPEELAQLWLEAIKTSSTAKIRPLIHPGARKIRSRRSFLGRMVQGGLPEDMKIETKELGPRAELEKIYQLFPEKQLKHKIPNEFSGGQGKIWVGQGLSDRNKASGEWFCLRSARNLC